MAIVGGHELSRHHAALSHSAAVPSERASRNPRDSRGKDATDFAVRDLQTLLADAVQRLRNTTYAEFVVAWALGEEGVPYVAAAAFAGADCPASPDAADFATAARLSRATDLGDRDVDSDLRDLARSYQFHAAAPVTSSSGAVLAILLLRAPDLEPVRTSRRQDNASHYTSSSNKTSKVAPRLLAQLDRATRSLSSPLSAALAAGRLHVLDERVRHLDRLAGLGQLTAEIAHEVRNPLVSMKTFLQLLPERKDDPEFLEQFCEIVGDELARLERLLDTLIDCGSPNPGQGAATEAGAPTESGANASGGVDGHSAQITVAMESVSRLLQHRATSRGVLLEIAALTDLPRVRMTPDRLRQVVLNLAMNAIDASPRGETVRLEGTVYHEDKALEDKAKEKSVELVVTDGGPGFPDELRDRIFEPFFSTHPEHPGGLGLAISRRIVEDAGGEIDALNLPDRGARFRVRLPIFEPGVS